MQVGRDAPIVGVVCFFVLFCAGGQDRVHKVAADRGISRIQFVECALLTGLGCEASFKSGLGDVDAVFRGLRH
jgi:hypothetical protein